MFAGYGLKSPGGGAMDYDSYAGLDVESKLVVVLRFIPGDASFHDIEFYDLPAEQAESFPLDGEFVRLLEKYPARKDGESKPPVAEIFPDPNKGFVRSWQECRIPVECLKAMGRVEVPEFVDEPLPGEEGYEGSEEEDGDAGAAGILQPDYAGPSPAERAVAAEVEATSDGASPEESAAAMATETTPTASAPEPAAATTEAKNEAVAEKPAKAKATAKAKPAVKAEAANPLD